MSNVHATDGWSIDYWNNIEEGSTSGSSGFTYTGAGTYCYLNLNGYLTASQPTQAGNMMVQMQITGDFRMYINSPTALPTGGYYQAKVTHDGDDRWEVVLTREGISAPENSNGYYYAKGAFKAAVGSTVRLHLSYDFDGVNFGVNRSTTVWYPICRMEPKSGVISTDFDLNTGGAARFGRWHIC